MLTIQLHYPKRVHGSELPTSDQVNRLYLHVSGPPGCICVLLNSLSPVLLQQHATETKPLTVSLQGLLMYHLSCPHPLPLTCPSRLDWPTLSTVSKVHTGWMSEDLPSLLSEDKIQVEMVCEWGRGVSVWRGSVRGAWEMAWLIKHLLHKGLFNP